MLGSLAVSSLLFMSYFVTHSVNPSPQNRVGYTPIQQCPNTVYSEVMSSIPICEPRDTLVKLDLPNDNAMIEEVMPSHVLVPRCSGVCYQGNNYHKCVPEAGGRSSEKFKVYVYVINVILHLQCDFKLYVHTSLFNKYYFFVRLFLTKGTHKGRANQKCNVPVLM